MKKLLLLQLMLFFSCSSNDKEEEISETPPQVIIKDTFFTWGPGDNLHPSHNPSNEYFNQGTAYADVNGDGIKDVLLSSAWDLDNDATIDWWIKQENGSLIKDSSFISESTQGLRAHKIVETDVNNDGNSDFILFGVDESDPNNFDGNFATLIWNDGIYDLVRVSEGTGLWFHGGDAGDLNGDGFVDVITAEYIWWGDGTGNFINSNIDIYNWCDSPLMYLIEDYNNDGFNDIILSTKTRHDRTTIVYGDGSNWDNPSIEKLPYEEEYRNPMDIKMIDINEDGILDILELRQKNDDDFGSIIISTTNVDFINSQDGNGMNGSNDHFGWTQMRIADVDGDGLIDIVAENYHDGNYNGIKNINGVWEKWLFQH